MLQKISLDIHKTKLSDVSNLFIEWCSHIKIHIVVVYTLACQIKVPPRLLIFEFFPGIPQCLFGSSRLFIISNIFLLTYTDIDDLNTNIPISTFQ